MRSCAAHKRDPYKGDARRLLTRPFSPARVLSARGHPSATKRSTSSTSG